MSLGSVYTVKLKGSKIYGRNTSCEEICIFPILIPRSLSSLLLQVHFFHRYCIYFPLKTKQTKNKKQENVDKARNATISRRWTPGKKDSGPWETKQGDPVPAESTT